MNPGEGPGRDRARAATLLSAVLEGRKTTDQLFGLESPTSPLVAEMVFGTLRRYHCLDPLVTRNLAKPLRKKDQVLRALMLVGAYQLHYLRIPDHAAVSETVAACRLLKRPWARGLVNAVLRKVAADEPDERSFCLPDWIFARLEADYPDQARALAAATLERAPMSLRVNVRRVQPDDYRARLAAAGLGSHPGWHPEHLVLNDPVATDRLLGYREGLVTVQDGGAQLAARLLAARAGRGAILDACAAPGGKLYHLAELLPQARLYGLERSPHRFRHLQAEAVRLGHHHVRLLLGDAATPAWRDASDHLPDAFDTILVDAPCSGSGTLRRHPDIKVLRQADDLPAYAATQTALLKNLWPLLAPGGTLAYCTCSLFSRENDQVVEAFLAGTPDAEVVPVHLPTGRATRHGWQMLPLPAEPGVANLSVDGFFLAFMTRREKAR